MSLTFWLGIRFKIQPDLCLESRQNSNTTQIESAKQIYAFTNFDAYKLESGLILDIFDSFSKANIQKTRSPLEKEIDCLVTFLHF